MSKDKAKKEKKEKQKDKNYPPPPKIGKVFEKPTETDLPDNDD